MKDCFYEQGVSKQNAAIETLIYYVSIVAAVIMGVMALMMLSAMLAVGITVQALAMTLIPAVCAVILFFLRGRLRMEYDYTFTNGEMDFSVIYNGTKRRELGSVKVQTAEAVGKVAGNAFQRYLSMPEMKQHRWFLNRGAELYYIYAQTEGVRHLYVFEPDEEMVQSMKQFIPAGVMQE